VLESAQRNDVVDLARAVAWLDVAEVEALGFADVVLHHAERRVCYHRIERGRFNCPRPSVAGRKSGRV
jgi:hypothetical protein